MVYKNLVTNIRKLINQQGVTIGDCLPSEIQLAERFGASRITVRKALSVLIQKGLLERQQGRGAFIIGKDPKHDNTHINSFTEHMKMLGKTPHSDISEFKIISASQVVAGQLNITTNEKVYYIKQ